MSFKVDAIRPSEYEEFYSFLAVAFEKTPWDYFRPFYENDPWMRDDLVRVVRDNGRIVCSVTVFDRTVWLEGKKVRMGGIGNVATDPSARGKGLAGIVLEDCKDLMKREGFDVSLLFAGPVPLYEKHGWKSLDVSSCVFTGLRPAGTAGDLVIRPLSWEKERFAVREIHSDFVRTVNFAAERNMSYWNGYVRGFKNRTCDIHGAFKGRECRAYAMVDFDRKDKVLWLKELCWTSKEELPTILSGLLTVYTPAKVKVGKTGSANPVLSALKGLSSGTECQPEKGFMACNINARFDMTSAGFNANILHFQGDDF